MENTVEQIRSKWAKLDAVRDEGLTTPENIQRFDDILYGEDETWNKLDVYCLKGTDAPPGNHYQCPWGRLGLRR